MSNIKTMLLILFAINNAALIFLLFERGRMLRLNQEYLKRVSRQEERINRAADHITILGAKVFERDR